MNIYVSFSTRLNGLTVYMLSEFLINELFIYAVLSDKGKRRIYDAGLVGLLADDDDEVSLC